MAKNEIVRMSVVPGILQKPGDKMMAYVSKKGRKVAKVSLDNGNVKYSSTKYPNGTIVETKTTKSM